MERNDCNSLTSGEIKIADITWVVAASTGFGLSVIAASLSIVTRRYRSCLHRLSLYIVLASCLRTALMLLREIQDPAAFITVDSLNEYGAYLLVSFNCWVSVYIMSLTFLKQKLNKAKYELIGGIIVVLCPMPFVAANVAINYLVTERCSLLYKTLDLCLLIPTALGVLFSVASQCAVVGAFIKTTAKAGVHRKYRTRALRELIPLMAQVFFYELGICLNLTSRILVLASGQRMFASEEIGVLFPIPYLAIALVSICNPSYIPKGCSPCHPSQGARVTSTPTSEHAHARIDDQLTVPSHTHYVVRPETTVSEVAPLIINSRSAVI